MSVAPNPTTASRLRVLATYGGPTPTPTVLTVQGMLGQIIFRQAVIMQPGDNVFTPTTALTPGVYWLRLSSEAMPSILSTRVLVAE